MCQTVNQRANVGALHLEKREVTGDVFTINPKSTFKGIETYPSNGYKEK